jgi:hypothetical protein
VSTQSAAADYHTFLSRGGHPHTAQKPEDGKEVPNVINEWAASILFNKYELGGPFGVLIYLGDSPEEDQWHTRRSFVGSSYAYVSVNHGETELDNERDRSGGYVLLNWAMVERSGLSSFEPSVVVPYLKDNLHWRVEAVRVFSFCLASIL